MKEIWRNLWDRFRAASWLSSWRPYLILFLLVFSVYGASLFFDYTYLDDNTLVINNQEIIGNWHNVGRFFVDDVFFSNDKSYYRPLLNLSLLLDYQVAGTLPVIFHLSNILWHFFSVALLFFFLRSLGLRKTLSFWLAAIFTVHPALVPAVSWIPGRNDSMLAAFSLAASIFLLHYAKNHRLSFLLAYLAFFSLALFTKETAIVIPFIWTLYFLLVDRKSWQAEDWLAFLASSVSLSFIWMLIRNYALMAYSGHTGQELISLTSNWPAVIFGFGKFFLPFSLSALPVMPDSTIIYGLLSIVLLLIAFFWPAKRPYRLFIFGLFWFFVFLAPSLIRLQGQADFIEHRLYLPFIGLLISLSALSLVQDLDLYRRRVAGALFILVLVLSVSSLWRSRDYQDSLTFWRAAAKNSPHSVLAQKNLGAMLYFSGQPQAALERYQAALAINQSEAMVHNNIGVIYLDAGLLDQAEKEFRLELLINPGYENALKNLENLSMARRRLKK
jgi:tetratricopeptide (TPR) repeat protein